MSVKNIAKQVIITLVVAVLIAYAVIVIVSLAVGYGVMDGMLLVPFFFFDIAEYLLGPFSGNAFDFLYMSVILQFLLPVISIAVFRRKHLLINVVLIVVIVASCISFFIELRSFGV